MRRIQVIDSHTGGEPTRLIIGGGPDLGGGSLAERRDRFRLLHDEIRSAVVNEPRGSDVVVGGLLCEPIDATCVAGVIFFNNVGYLNMCGHGTIGLIATLAHLGHIGPGSHRIETPVGVVETELLESAEVVLTNVPSYRWQKGVELRVEGYGKVRGDVAWGGNWFFLIEEHGLRLEPSNVDRLIEFTSRVRQALRVNGVTGEEDAEIDHVELFAPAERSGVDSRNFVLCPGWAYDRSPCGTGTSAKMACLFADGRLSEGMTYRQESIVGSTFEGSVRIVDGAIHPQIKGTAYVTAEATLLLDPRDPFCVGIRH
jgi:4-hydroxyproline epimerase